MINPPFQDGTYLTNEDTVKKEYCTDTGGLFNNWTSIDRQTELTDDDGTLTGLSNNLSGTAKQTISVNDDSFFNAPLETAECASATGENAKPKNACTRQKEEQPATARDGSPYAVCFDRRLSQIDGHAQKSLGSRLLKSKLLRHSAHRKI